MKFYLDTVQRLIIILKTKNPNVYPGMEEQLLETLKTSHVNW